MQGRIKLIFLLLLAVLFGRAQTISQYEYWLDADYGHRHTVATNSTIVEQSVDISSLSEGIHYLNFRAENVDSVSGLYYRYLFMVPASEMTDATLSGYEYWVDADYANRVSSSEASANVAQSIDISGMSPGIHYLNFRAKRTDSEAGQYYRYLFMVPASEMTDATLSGYEYWVDEDYAHRVSSSETSANVAQSIDVSRLSSGIHYLNFRAKRTDGEPGLYYRYLFVVPDKEENNLQIDQVKFWIDDDEQNSQTMKVEAGSEIAISMDISQLEAGSTHTFNINAVSTDGLETPLGSYEFTLEAQAEPEPYAVLTEVNSNPAEGTIVPNNSRAETATTSNYTLTLYYDTMKDSRQGAMAMNPDGTNVPWGEYAESITSITIDSTFVDFHAWTMANWFSGFTSLTSINGMEYLNTEGTTSLRSLFQRCYLLDSIDVSHFNTESVEDMAAMFNECNSLRSIDCSNFNTSNVLWTYGMFGNCAQLETINVSGFENVGECSNMFSNCPNLKTIYSDRDWDIDMQINRETVFADCNSLVGGNGTYYSATHGDCTYARIDREGVPGYFTQNGTKPYVGPAEQVASPIFGFEGYDLTMSTETEGATIRYTMEQWTYENIDSAYVQADKMTVDISGAIYDGPIGTVTHNVIVKAYASKEGMTDSEISTLVYYGSAWQQLQDVIGYGETLIDEANGNEKVNQELVDNLHWALEEGAMMYEHRAEASGQEATMWIEHIGEFCKQIEEQLNATIEQVATPAFAFSEDELYLSTETSDAKIYYAIQKYDNNLETDTIAKYARNLQVSVDSIEYKNPIEANFDFIIKAMAVKDGMENSKDTTYIYPYTEWQKMLQTIDIGHNILSTIMNGEHSDEIANMIADAHMRMAEIESTYWNNRTEWDRETVIHERENLEAFIDYINRKWQEEQSQKTTATYENYVLTVEGQTTMALALEQVGGRDVVAKDIAAIVWNSTEAITRSDIEGFGNPNLLIYVQADSLAPEGVNNVVVDGKAKNIVLVDADGNNNFYAPQEFTAESISYTREFKQTTQKDVSRGWEGICLPFTVQTYTHESHGAIAPFRNNASDYHFWLRQMTDKGLTTAENIEANMPYIISMPNSDAYPEAYNQAGKVTFAAENAKISKSIAVEIQLADRPIIVSGTYHSIATGYYALNVGHEYEGNPEGSIFILNYREIRPFEIFTWHNGSGARSISISSLFGGEGTTGIIDVIAEPDSDRWYDMNGRRLQSKPVRKGIYIKNGKKVVIK